MSRFKLTASTSDRDSDKEVLGTFSSIHDAAKELFNYAKSKGSITEYDKFRDVETALECRGYYGFGWYNLEGCVEEVNA